MRLLDAICNRPWLATPESLRTIVEVVSGTRRDEELAAAIRAEREDRPAALALRDGVQLDTAPRVTVRNGVAHIAIIGPIVRRADLFSRVSGLTSLDALAFDLDAALAAPTVRAILLELDTPGGEVTGIAAFAEAITAARRTKPVHAYVDGMAASAGYWLASAAETITVDAAGMVGSIGAVLAVRDPAQRQSQIEFVSSQSPHKRANPTTDDGKAQYQRIVDQTAEAFVEAVARNRGVTPETVLANYGQGGMFVGRHAVDAGMADRVGTFETALAALAQSRRNVMDWKSMFSGMFAAAEEVQPSPPPAAQPAAPPSLAIDVLAELMEPPHTDDPATLERLAQAEAHAEALAAQLAEAQAEAQVHARVAFVNMALADGRIVPAEVPALQTLYAQAQGAGMTRAVEALIAARPAHLLTTEQVAGESAAALSLVRSPEPDAARVKSLLALTPDGRAALK